MPGLHVGGFGLADNLMVVGAVLETGGAPLLVPPDGHDRAFDSLEMFEACVSAAAARLQDLGSAAPLQDLGSAARLREAGGPATPGG